MSRTARGSVPVIVEIGSGVVLSNVQSLRELGADVPVIHNEPNGMNINDGCGATDLAMLQAAVRAGGYDLGIAFDGDGDRMLAVDARGEISFAL